MTDSVLEEVLALPLFAGLEPHARDLAARSLARQELAAGARLVTEGEAADHLYCLVRGEVAVSRGGSIQTVIAAPSTIGLLGVLDGKGRSASMSAFRDCVVYSLGADVLRELMAGSTVFDRNVIAFLSSELREGYSRTEGLLSHLADFFDSPNARMVPGPYKTDPFEMLLFVVADRSGAIRRLLPEGVTPMPGTGDRYLLTFNFFDRTYTTHPNGAGKSFAYVETCPFVPCLVDSFRPAAFCPELYPDNYLAIAIGRELYGFPKRFGRTVRRGRVIDLIVDQKMVLRAEWRGERRVEASEFGGALTGALGVGGELPAAARAIAGTLFDLAMRPSLKALRPRVPVLVRRQVVDVDPSSERLAVDELVEIPFEIDSMAAFTILDGAAIEDLDLDHFLCGECVAAFSLRLGFGFAGRRVLRDYAPRPAGAEDRSLGRWVSSLLGR